MRQPEHAPAVRARRREHAEPVQQARVAQRDRRGRFVDEVAVEPDEWHGEEINHRRTPMDTGGGIRQWDFGSTPSAANIARAFTSVSSYSAAGSESATMAPPTGMWTRPSFTIIVRMATLNSSAPSAAT